jgi:lipopolysaccharide exporter
VSLAKKAAAGFLWTTLANVGGRLVTIVSTFFVARFVLPFDQGEFNSAFVIVYTASNATQLGVQQYLAANPESGRQVAFHGGVLTLGAGLIGCALVLAFGGPIANVIGSPGIAHYIPGLVAAHMIERVGWLPRNVLVRDMQFRKVGMRAFVGEVTFAGVSVALAARGWGGDALLVANLVRAVVGLVYLVSVTSWREYLEPCRLKLETFRSMLRFGAPISVSMLFHYGATTWDNLFIAWRFGPATTGLYNQAYKLAELPATYIGEQINDVLVPTFARVSDPEARARGFLRAASLMALVVCPLAVGLGSVAYTAVQTFYPPTYAGVAPFLAVLASLSMFRSIGVLSAGLLQVVGRTRILAVIDLVLIVLLLGSMLILSSFGAVWAAVGVGIAFFLNAVHVVRELKPEGIRLRSVAGALVGPMLACLLMAAAVFGVRQLLEPAGLHPALRLTIEVLVGAVTYVASAFVVARPIAQDFVTLATSIVQRRRGAPASG